MTDTWFCRVALPHATERNGPRKPEVKMDRAAAAPPMTRCCSPLHCMASQGGRAVHRAKNQKKAHPGRGGNGQRSDPPVAGLTPGSPENRPCSGCGWAGSRAWQLPPRPSLPASAYLMLPPALPSQGMGHHRVALLARLLRRQGDKPQGNARDSHNHV
jgi:hypothetical protein